MSVSPLISPRIAEANAVAESRVHLAAAHRLAVLHELEEGIDNHFTMTVPGRDGQYLILPFGLHWSEARASDLIVFDEAGRVLEGEGTLELSAQCIHAPIHRITGARVVLHTHQTWATALNMLADNRLLAGEPDVGVLPRPDRLRRRLHRPRRDARGRRAPGRVDGNEADRLHEEPRRPRHRRHGRAGVPAPVPDRARLPQPDPRVEQRPAAAGAQRRDRRARQAPNPEDRHPRGERERLFFEAMMRVLDRELPGYRD